jgi:hypothetical protein
MSTVHGSEITSNEQQASTPRDEYPADYDYAGEKGDGWIAFAAIMLGLAGVMGLLAGLAAIAGSSFYVNGARFVFSDLKTWGWIVTIAAVVTLCAAFAIVAGAQWARWFGIVIASLQAIAQLAFIQAYPFWSLCVFTLDLLVIYALAVYGGSRKNA